MGRPSTVSVREAAKALLDACLAADANEDLDSTIDGALLDALSTALRAVELPRHDGTPNDMLREFVNLCAVGDVNEDTDALGWGDLIGRAKAYLAT